MRITLSPINFGYKSILKSEYLKGNIKLKKDITGNMLTKDNVTLDHTIPKVRGGKSRLDNYSLMVDYINHRRGSNNLKDIIDLPSLIDYITIIINTKTRDFDGVEYLKGWLKNLRKEIWPMACGGKKKKGR